MGKWGNRGSRVGRPASLDRGDRGEEAPRDLGDCGGWCSKPLTPTIPSCFQWCYSLAFNRLLPPRPVYQYCMQLRLFSLSHVCVMLFPSRPPLLHTTSLANIVSTFTSPGLIAKSGVIMEPRDSGGNGLMPSGIPHRYGWASILLVHHISTSDGIELPSSRKDPIYSRGRSHVVRFNGTGNRAWGFMNHLGTTSRLPRDIGAGHTRRSWPFVRRAGRRTVDKHMRQLHLVIQD